MFVCVCVWGGSVLSVCVFCNLHVFLFEFPPMFVHSFNKNATEPLLGSGLRSVTEAEGWKLGWILGAYNLVSIDRPLSAPQPCRVVNLIGKGLRNHLLNPCVAEEGRKCNLQRVSGLTKVTG